MKKMFLFLEILFALLFCSMLIKWTFVELFYAEPTIIQRSISPDGKYTAYMFESNGGATTRWTYHISILPTGKKLGKGNGNIYTNDTPPRKIVWLNDRTLYVDDYKSANVRRKEKKYGISVKYTSLSKLFQQKPRESQWDGSVVLTNPVRRWVSAASFPPKKTICTVGASPLFPFSRS